MFKYQFFSSLEGVKVGSSDILFTVNAEIRKWAGPDCTVPYTAQKCLTWDHGIEVSLFEDGNVHGTEQILKLGLHYGLSPRDCGPSKLPFWTQKLVIGFNKFQSVPSVNQ